MRSSLKQVEKELKEVIEAENTDRIDDFINQTLYNFHEDIMTAKRNRAVPVGQAEQFKDKYSKYANQLQNLKKELKNKIVAKGKGHLTPFISSPYRT